MERERQRTGGGRMARVGEATRKTSRGCQQTTALQATLASERTNTGLGTVKFALATVRSDTH